MNHFQFEQLRQINHEGPAWLAPRNVSMHMATPAHDRPGRFEISFTYCGSRELAKYHVTNYLKDCISASCIEFFSYPDIPHLCFVQFRLE